MKLGLLAKSVYQLDFDSFVKTFQADPEDLMRVLKRGEYPKDFIDSFRRQFGINSAG